MINVLAIKDRIELDDFCVKNDIHNFENRGVVLARDGEEVLGFCAYLLNSDSIYITHLSPENDAMLADGILRSALHVADFRGIDKAYYSETAPIALLNMLGFIKDGAEKSLKIEKLHESCCSCNN